MKKTESWRSAKKLPLKMAAKLKIATGCHNDRSNGLCVMEAAAWLSGEPHSDHPKCVSNVIGSFLRNWNDSISDDVLRAKIMKPLLKVVMNTSASDAIELRRATMCDDWAIRVSTPAWLELAGLKSEATALRALPEIVDRSGLDTAMPALRDAQSKAAAAWAAAGDAAWAAARDAAWAAAWAAARDAARAAARAAARDAAWAAAGDAAWAAAGDAAGARLAPTVATLQKSASDLVVRMARLSKEKR